jgi:excisionase family DNA binding protein
LGIGSPTLDPDAGLHRALHFLTSACNSIAVEREKMLNTAPMVCSRTSRQANRWSVHVKNLITAVLPPPPMILLTPRDAAKALALSERTLWELTKRGVIARLKIGASVRYDVKDLEAFIESQKQKGGAL